MTYEVSTSVFEGPFDLLLHLIIKQEVDLWEISLSRIVDEYLSELERMEGFDLEVTTEFLLIAATLVDLKARRLLPSLEEVELDEELLRFEERDLLLARLLECKTFKDAAHAMETLVRRADRRRAPGTGAKADADDRGRAHRADSRQRARRGRSGVVGAARGRSDQLPRLGHRRAVAAR